MSPSVAQTSGLDGLRETQAFDGLSLFSQVALLKP